MLRHLLVLVLFWSCADSPDSPKLPPPPPPLPPFSAPTKADPAPAAPSPRSGGASLGRLESPPYAPSKQLQAPRARTSSSESPPFPTTPPQWLCAGSLGSWSRNRGGSSISFRMMSAGGARAAFKPDQLAGSSRFRAEIGAYRVSSLLGYGRVPPSCERSVGASVLRAAAGPDADFRARLEHELSTSATGTVRGAAIQWVSGIRPLEIGPSRVRAHPLVTQLSDMIWFDELVGNWDRWSGGNVFTDGTGREIVLIDNAAAFAPIGLGRRRRMDVFLDAALAPTAQMLAALRSLRPEELEGAMAGVGLSESQLAEVIERRDRILSRLSGASGSGAAR